ncbi:MAG TPA: magnesium/cobalt transporter CorA [Abditibacteriaceae bacterium]|nr:magnesium/cobalt transporter CorA [Abditibacteriaceae bacterium]
MLCAYLYNTSQNELTLLDSADLLASAPAPDEAARKRADANGTARCAQPQCRTDEILWVDITKPGAEDFKLLKQRFALHPMIVEDIKSKEGRPKLHDYGKYLYIIFHALRVETGAPPALKDGEPKDKAGESHFDLRMCEIDCLVGPDYVVTLHDEPLQPLDDLRDRWLVRPELMQAGTSYLLYEIMDEVLDDYFPLLDALDERIDDFEDRLFTSYQSGLSSDIFSLKRCLVKIRHIAGPTRDVVNALMRYDADRGGRHFIYFQDLYDHAVRIVDMIDTFRDILSGALDAYLAMQSNRMNEVMKTLTSASIILLIPTLMAGIYGMNFDNMPELRTRYGYFIALGVMAATMVGFYSYFKRKDWL